MSKSLHYDKISTKSAKMRILVRVWLIYLRQSPQTLTAFDFAR